MKTQTQFKNASLVSVVNGTIVVKDSNGGEHTYVNASVVSVNNGTITIESEWKPKKGELVKVLGSNIDCYVIFNTLEGHLLQTFGGKELFGPYYKLANEHWAYNDDDTKFHPVTPKEQKEFDDFCKSQGKIWNKEKLQWEKYRWKPEYQETYYFIDLFPDSPIRTHRWVHDNIDKGYYKTNNCFKTKEEAEAKLEQIKKLLANG